MKIIHKECDKCRNDMCYMGIWPALDKAGKLYHRFKCETCKIYPAELVE